jgi:DNA-binding response OmpR family regulator
MAARILVVNDTAEILEAFEALLTGEGYEVSLFSYAPHDLLEVRRVAPDLVILDLIFGSEKLGWQLLDKMRMTRETAAIPVIVCTAAVNEVRQNEGHLKAMGVTVVLKPFDIDMMLRVVGETLAAASRARTANQEPGDETR